MIYNKISLNENYPDCYLTLMVHDTPFENCMGQRSAVVLCPGGGYRMISDREKEPVAIRFFAAGFNVYILTYSVMEKARDFAPLIQAAFAIKYVREHASEHKTNPGRVFIMGFSAGGHLAASAGILWNIKPVRDALGITNGIAAKGINKPNGAILCYPVISGSEYRHKGSFNYLCGKDEPTHEERDVFSLEKQVNADSVPVFIWHTLTDATVPVQNALLLIDAYVKNNLPIEAHIFPDGKHGLSLCNEETTVADGKCRPDIAKWVELALDWIKYFKY